jgi:hypothetical protein
MGILQWQMYERKNLKTPADFSGYATCITPQKSFWYSFINCFGDGTNVWL